MRNLYITIAFFLQVITLTAQTPGWQWATGPVGQGLSSAVCADVNNNVYVTGHYRGTLAVGTDTLNDNAGAVQDVFIAKYNSLGQPLWVTGAVGYADAFGISADGNGHIYMVGNFYNDSIAFGNQVLYNPNAGVQNTNIFLVKYDSSGNLLWVKNLGGINNDIAAGISTDPAGNVYVTGNFIGDSLSFGNVTVQHLGANDGFVAKFDAAGNALWVRNTGSAFLNGSTGVSADGKGDVFITGYFLNNAVYIGNVDSALNSAYSNNVFAIKYDSSGNKRWAKYAGGDNGNGPGGIAADAQGNVYITGYFSDTIALDGVTLIGNGFQNIFTAKYDTAGVLIWAQGTGGNNIDQPTGIACDTDGNAYITGYFQSDTISFGGLQLINPAGNQVTFLAQYNTLGIASLAIAPGGNSNNTGAALCYSAGSIYVTGAFQSADVAFGKDTLLQSQQNIFLAKLDSIALTTGIAQVSSIAENVVVFPNPSGGNFYMSGVKYGDRIEVFNLMGQSVYSGSAANGIYTFNLTDKAKGVYLYRVVNTSGSVEQGKIVVE